MTSQQSRALLCLAALPLGLLLLALLGAAAGAAAVPHAPNGDAGHYIITTSANDEQCDTGFGGYIDLQQQGLSPDPRLSGDGKVWAAFNHGDPIHFLGVAYPALFFTDDGFIQFDYDENGGPDPQIPQALADPAKPNNLIALLWQDMEVSYDEATNTGITLATSGEEIIIVEYDDVHLKGDPGSSYDMELVQRRSPDASPNAYEIVLAYDNLQGSLAGPLTIGVENQSGSWGATLINTAGAQGVISDGFMVCLDYQEGMPPTATPTLTPTITPTATATPPPGVPRAGAYLPVIMAQAAQRHRHVPRTGLGPASR